MSGSPKLAYGKRVLFEGSVYAIAAIEGGALRLRGHDGSLMLITIRELAGAKDFQVLDWHAEDKERDLAALEGVPQYAIRQAQKRAAHLNEAITGYSSAESEAARPGEPRVEYGLDLTLTQRMKNKAEELGRSASTLWEWKKHYEEEDLFGLIDGRSTKAFVPGERLDIRLRAAILTVLDELTDASNRTYQQIFRRARRRLEKEHGEGIVPIPSDSTLYRAIEELTRGRGTKGPAKARRSTAGLPPTPYGHFVTTRPGEVVVIDSTPLDVFALDPLTLQWTSLELILAQDLFTRSILAWRLTPRGVRGVDAALLLRDVITPLEMQDGWPSSARWPYHGVPETVVLEAFGSEKVAARPLVAPDTAVTDRAPALMRSAVFRNACRRLKISVQGARLLRPTDKSQLERTFRIIKEQLWEELPGYKGPDLFSRGKDVEDGAFYFSDEIESFLATWVVCHWQNRPHSGLRMPGAPKQKMSPNEMYELGLSTAGFVYVPPSPDLYYELLPIKWHTIQKDGVNVETLKYDDDCLNAYRNRTSSYGGKHRGKWPIRYDPRRLSSVYFQDPADGAWHELPWKHEPSPYLPLNDTLLAHAKRIAFTRSGRRPKSEDLGREVAEIFERIERVQAVDPRERRVAVKSFMHALQADSDRGEQPHLRVNARRTDRTTIPDEAEPDEFLEEDVSDVEAFPLLSETEPSYETSTEEEIVS